MGFSKELIRQAEEELSVLRKKREKQNEERKKIFYQKFKEAEVIENKLLRTTIDASKAVFSGHADVKKVLTELKDKNLELQKKMKNILIRANFPLDYLDIKYNCNKCKDTGYVDGYMCECLKKLIKKLACDNLNKLSPLSLSTFEAFNVNYYPDVYNESNVNIKSHMTKIFNYCFKYAKNFNESSKNLLMQGNTGLGKTHLSLAIANTVINLGYNVIYVSTPNIVSKLEKEHFNNNFKTETTQEYLINCDLLILDDLGTEFQTNFSNSALYNIINNRMMYRKPTIMSTNLSMKEIQSCYSERLVSRIMGSYKRLFFLGKDIRQYLEKLNRKR